MLSDKEEKKEPGATSHDIAALLSCLCSCPALPGVQILRLALSDDIRHLPHPAGFQFPDYPFFRLGFPSSLLGGYPHPVITKHEHAGEEEGDDDNDKPLRHTLDVVSPRYG